MEFNILIIAAYLLRIGDKMLNKKVQFTWSTDTGKNNIRKTAFNGMLIALAYYLSFFIDYSHEFLQSNIKQIVIFLSVGWFIDSFFFKLLSYGETLISKILGEDKAVKEEDINDDEKSVDKTPAS